MLLKKYEKNPILEPRKDHLWESERVFNCAAVYENGKVHIIYRAQGEDGISRLGYALSSDGFHIEERSELPIFSPINLSEASGCEDPRITRIEDSYYMTYTAYGKRGLSKRMKQRLAQVAITSIPVNDFLIDGGVGARGYFPFQGLIVRIRSYSHGNFKGSSSCTIASHLIFGWLIPIHWKIGQLLTIK